MLPICQIKRLSNCKRDLGCKLIAYKNKALVLLGAAVGGGGGGGHRSGGRISIGGGRISLGDEREVLLCLLVICAVRDAVQRELVENVVCSGFLETIKFEVKYL